MARWSEERERAEDGTVEGHAPNPSGEWATRLGSFAVRASEVLIGVRWAEDAPSDAVRGAKERDDANRFEIGSSTRSESALDGEPSSSASTGSGSEGRQWTSAELRTMVGLAALGMLAMAVAPVFPTWAGKADVDCPQCRTWATVDATVGLLSLLFDAGEWMMPMSKVGRQFRMEPVTVAGIGSHLLVATEGLLSLALDCPWSSWGDGDVGMTSVGGFAILLSALLAVYMGCVVAGTGLGSVPRMAVVAILTWISFHFQNYPGLSPAADTVLFLIRMLGGAQIMALWAALFLYVHRRSKDELHTRRFAMALLTTVAVVVTLVAQSVVQLEAQYRARNHTAVLILWSVLTVHFLRRTVTLRADDVAEARRTWVASAAQERARLLRILAREAATPLEHVSITTDALARALGDPVTALEPAPVASLRRRTTTPALSEGSHVEAAAADGAGTPPPPVASGGAMDRAWFARLQSLSRELRRNVVLASSTMAHVILFDAVRSGRVDLHPRALTADGVVVRVRRTQSRLAMDRGVRVHMRHAHRLFPRLVGPGGAATPFSRFDDGADGAAGAATTAPSASAAAAPLLLLCLGTDAVVGRGWAEAGPSNVRHPTTSTTSSPDPLWPTDGMRASSSSGAALSPTGGSTSTATALHLAQVEDMPMPLPDMPRRSTPREEAIVEAGSGRSHRSSRSTRSGPAASGRATASSPTDSGLGTGGRLPTTATAADRHSSVASHESESVISALRGTSAWAPRRVTLETPASAAAPAPGTLLRASSELPLGGESHPSRSPPRSTGPFPSLLQVRHSASLSRLFGDARRPSDDKRADTSGSSPRTPAAAAPPSPLAVSPTLVWGDERVIAYLVQTLARQAWMTAAPGGAVIVRLEVVERWRADLAPRAPHPAAVTTCPTATARLVSPDGKPASLWTAEPSMAARLRETTLSATSRSSRSGGGGGSSSAARPTGQHSVRAAVRPSTPPQNLGGALSRADAALARSARAMADVEAGSPPRDAALTGTPVRGRLHQFLRVIVADGGPAPAQQDLDEYLGQLPSRNQDGRALERLSWIVSTGRRMLPTELFNCVWLAHLSGGVLRAFSVPAEDAADPPPHPDTAPPPPPPPAAGRSVPRQTQTRSPASSGDHSRSSTTREIHPCPHVQGMYASCCLAARDLARVRARPRRRPGRRAAAGASQAPKEAPTATFAFCLELPCAEALACCPPPSETSSPRLLSSGRTLS